jgi:alpha-galactosidase
MCEWGVERPSEWANEFGNSWRTTGDIEDKWESFINILDQ